MSRIAFAIDIDAPAEQVFAAVVDWRGQDRWIPATTVRVTNQAGIAVGGEIVAVTGVGLFSIVDTMVITRWDIPERVDVRHVGNIIKGIGIMRVIPISPERARFLWAEDIDVPFGLLGRSGWAVLKPGYAALIRRSLRKFAGLVESGELGTKL
jgi:hypothetical protein